MFEAALPHLKEENPRSFPFIQTSEVLAQYHPFTHELNPWSDERLCRAPFGLSVLQKADQFEVRSLPISETVKLESIAWISSLKKHMFLCEFNV